MTAAINFFLCILISSYSCEAFKILVVYPMPSKSHSILGHGVVRQLLKDGHEVTYITAIEYKKPPPNLRQIDVSENFEILPEEMINLQKIMEKKVDTNDHRLVKKMMTDLMTKTIQDNDVKKLLSDINEHFDAVIIEWMFSDVLSGIASIFNCPLIWVAPVEINAGIITLIDTAPSPAHTADPLSGNLPPFSFWQRVEELWTRIIEGYRNYMYYDDMERETYEKELGPFIVQRGRAPPPYHEVRYNASLVLGNSHVSIGQAISVPHNYKPIGGYHIEENIEPLPEDLKKIMESAKNGVIYFSMGSNLKSKDWPEETKRSLLKMFGELKQTVLWKFEEDLPDVPKNVHILKWAPQPSILSHPKCVLFITHGGLLSQTETIHYGVPIIGIPVFGDQFVNVKRAVAKGFALEVDLTRKVADGLKIAIQEMLHNPKYRQKVKELSFIYHDRIAKPSEELSHWVKHVINTRGALHLRSTGFNVPLYQRLYLDLAAIIAVALLAILLLLRALCTVVCPKKKVVRGKKNN